jgi:hypothetical protein
VDISDIAIGQVYSTDDIKDVARINAAAESFNAKLKEFRKTFRGVIDMNFFLFQSS